MDGNLVLGLLLNALAQSEEDIITDLVRCIEKMEDLMEDLHKNSMLFT